MLDQIEQPGDLKALSVPELETLCGEIRQFLIEQLSKTGGHLAPNLGVVELTVALHYWMNSPVDKIVFDVGHQAYVHKILTGRKHLFPTLRKYKGLSGFVKRKESEHDQWEAGHSSTSLSAAMGMAYARDQKGENHHVVAMIGDGALTGGMALEALNHIGHEKTKMLVILNDNEMSIAPNVGALHNYLGKVRADRHFQKVKDDIEHFLRKIPAFGEKMANMFDYVKDRVKYLVVPGVLFEELGFTYLGPLDGHDLPQILEALEQTEHIQGPVLLHVITTKGKGYAPAEADSYKWHGITPYKIESGEVLSSGAGQPWYSDVFAQTLTELANHDQRIIAVTAAMPSGTALSKFAKQHPTRMVDVGIAEQHAAAFCAAMAMQGMKPVFAVYSTFLQRAYDQIVHDVCRHNANVVFAIDRAGFVGADGETHQGVYDLAYLRHIPNMVIMMPKDENELRHLMKTAIEYNDGPIAIRYPRMNGLGVTLDPVLKPVPVGSWETVREGHHASIIAMGPMLQIAEEAAARLEKDGKMVRVINARFVKPLDGHVLAELSSRQSPVLVLEETSMLGGLGSAILEWYAMNGYQAPPVRLLGIPDVFVEHGSIREQREECGLTVEQVITHLQAFFASQRKSQLA